MAELAVNSNNNYSQISCNKLIQIMSTLYAKGDFSSQPTKMLWGQPGVGKSQAVQQFANILSQKTGKKTYVKTVSLLLMNPIDHRGIPAQAKDERGEDVAKWLSPDIFKLDPSDEVINILFLDEISAAPPSVQAAAYQICLDKRIGEHVLPANTIVICAGNRVTDKAVAFKMPKPLANRLTHFEIIADLDSWRSWAYQHNINDSIIGFITWQPDYLNKFDPVNDDVAFPTPRSWELVNTYMQFGFDEMFDCIAGTIGLATAIELKAFIDIRSKLPLFSDIIADKAELPDNDTPAIMYAVLSMITSNVIKTASDLKTKEKDNLLKYIASFKHDEYILLILQDIIRNCPELNGYLLKNKNVAKFLKQIHSDLFG